MHTEFWLENVKEDVDGIIILKWTINNTGGRELESFDSNQGRKCPEHSNETSSSIIWGKN